MTKLNLLIKGTYGASVIQNHEYAPWKYMLLARHCQNLCDSFREVQSELLKFLQPQILMLIQDKELALVIICQPMPFLVSLFTIPCRDCLKQLSLCQAHRIVTSPRLWVPLCGLDLAHFSLCIQLYSFHIVSSVLNLPFARVSKSAARCKCQFLHQCYQFVSLKYWMYFLVLFYCFW